MVPVHRYNFPIMALYNACSDQILGEGYALNDLAIVSAMNNYFTVKKKDRLPLSLAVRSFFHAVQKEREARKK